ncbi:uncharacterized protein ACN427_008395 isoform 1-T3 [Glossina fuscipes fuscipes]
MTSADKQFHDVLSRLLRDYPDLWRYQRGPIKGKYEELAGKVSEEVYCPVSAEKVRTVLKNVRRHLQRLEKGLSRRTDYCAYLWYAQELGLMRAAEAMSKLIEEKEFFEEEVMVNADGGGELAQEHNVLLRSKVLCASTPRHVGFHDVLSRLLRDYPDLWRYQRGPIKGKYEELAGKVSEEVHCPVSAEKVRTVLKNVRRHLQRLEKGLSRRTDYCAYLWYAQELGLMRAAEAMSKLIEEKEFFEEEVMVNADGGGELAQEHNVLLRSKVLCASTPRHVGFHDVLSRLLRDYPDLWRYQGGPIKGKYEELAGKVSEELHRPVSAEKVRTVLKNVRRHLQRLEKGLSRRTDYCAYLWYARELDLMRAAEAMSKLIEEKEFFQEEVMVNVGDAFIDELAQEHTVFLRSRVQRASAPPRVGSSAHQLLRHTLPARQLPRFSRFSMYSND